MDYYEELWSALVDFLADMGPVESTPTGLRVDVRPPISAARQVEVTLTREQWAMIVSVLGGQGLPAALQDVRRVLTSGRHPYVVYCDYALVARWTTD